MDRWWKIDVDQGSVQGLPEELETLCYDLIELGAVTTSVDTSGVISCFLNGDEDSVQRFTRSAIGRGVVVVGTEEIEPHNWNERCIELWQPVRAGSFEILPVESVHDTRQGGSSSIRIIPGEGFGTGHHPTTRMIVEELCELKGSGRQPSRILDIGTGSGILAIVAAKLFEAPIEATDIDAHALGNAQDNVALNSVESRIRLSTDDIDALARGFDLVLANLYGEVLVKLQASISETASSGALLLLSGITELVRDPVFEAYVESGPWTLVRERSEGHWVCLVLERR
jgi:ribosomal protein L11 methyltransferase